MFDRAASYLGRGGFCESRICLAYQRRSRPIGRSRLINVKYLFCFLVRGGGLRLYRRGFNRRVINQRLYADRPYGKFNKSRLWIKAR